MREAGQVLHTAVHRWIVSFLAKSATPVLEDRQPRYILLRPNTAESWEIKNFEMFVFDHVRTGIRCFSFFSFLGMAVPISARRVNWFRFSSLQALERASNAEKFCCSSWRKRQFLSLLSATDEKFC